MEPQANDSLPKPQANDKFDISNLPDLQPEWTGAVSKDIWGPQNASSSESDFSAFSVHKGAKFIAGNGALVSTDNQQPPEPPRQYSTRYKTSYYKVGPVLLPSETEVRTPIEREYQRPLGAAQVEARDGSKVLARDSFVSARMGSFVQAQFQSHVEAFEGSTVRAQRGSDVTAHHGSRVLAENQASVTARSGSRIVALDGSTVLAEPGAEIEARAGSTISVFRRLDDKSTAATILKAEKGSSINISDGLVVIDPATLADVRFTGNEEAWETFKSKNPNLKIDEPDFTTMADSVRTRQYPTVMDLIYGTNRRETPQFQGPMPLTEPPSPAPPGNYEAMERNIKRIQELRDKNRR